MHKSGMIHVILLQTVWARGCPLISPNIICISKVFSYENEKKTSFPFAFYSLIR